MIKNLLLFAFNPNNFKYLNNLFKFLQIFAIGPTTAAAIREAGYILSGICEKPKPESMINMIDEFIKYAILPK